MGGFGHFLRGAAQTFQDLIADRYQQQQLAQNKQQTEAQQQIERDKLAEEKKFHDSQTAAAQAQLKAALALHNVQAAETAHNMTLKSLQYGIPIPGSVETNRQAVSQTGAPLEMSPAGGNFISTQQLPIQTANISPSGEFQTAPMQVQIPSQEQFMRQQAQMQRIAGAPAAEAKSAATKEEYGLIGANQTSLENLRGGYQLQVAKENEAAANARNKADIHSREYIASQENRMRIQVAQINRGMTTGDLEIDKNLADQDTEISQHVNLLSHAKESTEQFLRQTAKRPFVQQQVFGRLAASGLGAPTQKQTEVLQNSGLALGLHQINQQIIDILDHYPTLEIANLPSPVLQRINNLQAQARERLAAATPLFTPQQRLSDSRIKRMIDAYEPRKLQRSSVNEGAMYAFDQALEEVLRSHLPTFSREQQDLIIGDRRRETLGKPRINPKTGQPMYSDDGGKSWHDEHGKIVGFNY